MTRFIVCGRPSLGQRPYSAAAFHSGLWITAGLSIS